VAPLIFLRALEGHSCMHYAKLQALVRSPCANAAGLVRPRQWLRDSASRNGPALRGHSSKV